MRNLYRAGLLGAGIVMAGVAQAGEAPLYQPAPAWVLTAPAPDPAKLPKDGPGLVIFDAQQRIEGGTLWSYVDTATRIDSPEVLAQLANLTMSWAPDKGDLIVHELSILRGTERIDLLAKGQKFTVLRREQTLEQRELTGILTATLATEGLQVGDVLRVRFTTSAKDDALGGRVQTAEDVVSAPIRVGYGRLRFSWPAASAPRWKLAAEGVTAAPVTKGGFTGLTIALPAPKPPEMPADAPLRFRHPPYVELSTFAGWSDVSKTFAPLYATEGAIAPGSPLAAEVAAVEKAEATPLGRAERALELVQDKVRYLAVGMNGGNYVPQKPAKTWELRYGDCKAKTLLLLSLLHAMKIEAEPVLASADMGDLVPQRLPSAAAFNHVLVRATIGGESLWLDGTGLGSRLSDIRDTPPFRHVLPIRGAGADLLALPAHANARPLLDVAIDADESAASDVPSAFEATAVLRGPFAAMMKVAGAQLGEKEKRDGVGQFFQSFLGEAQFSSAAIVADDGAGSVTLTARGVVTSPWTVDGRERKRGLSRIFETIDFSPDRGRPAWQSIPVATPGPQAMRYRLRLRLPDQGQGYRIEGEPDLKGRVGGYDVARAVRLAGGVVTVDERVETAGGEIAAADIAAERDRFATAKARLPRVVAPENARRHWDLTGADPAGATQVKAVDETLAKAIAAAPDEVSGYTSRASFRAGIGDRKGALADYSRAIAIEPSVDLYLHRAGIAYELNDVAGAFADAEAARKLDPASTDAIQRVAYLKAERGDLAGAVALLDERIALGGDTKNALRGAKAEIVGIFGDPAESVKIWDALIAEKPGSPSLLNGRCWVKGTRTLLLETALKDCTEAIELSSKTTAALDSRAMVWYRLGRDQEALRDLDAVLAAVPGQAASRYLRAIVLTRLHRDADAAKDFALARRLSPEIDREYARFGLGPKAAAGAVAGGSALRASASASGKR